MSSRFTHKLPNRFFTNYTVSHIVFIFWLVPGGPQDHLHLVAKIICQRTISDGSAPRVSPHTSILFVILTYQDGRLMVATLFDNGILLPTSFEILVSDVIHGYVLPIVRISLKRSCHVKATDFI